MPLTMGALWDTGDMKKAPTYSAESEKKDGAPARADGAECGSGEARHGAPIGARGALRGLDARAKIALMLAYSVALFCAKGLAGLGVAAALLAAVALFGRVPLVRLLREGAFAYLIVGFLLVYNIVASGWLAGVAVAARLVLLVWASLLLMALSTPMELSEALRRLLSPLGRLGLPVRDFTTSLSIALRFMPLFAEELGAVRAAQASRGAAFEDGGIARRLRAYGGLMVPVRGALPSGRSIGVSHGGALLWSFRRTDVARRASLLLWRWGGLSRRRCRLHRLRAYSLGACDKVAVVLVDYRNAARLRGVK